MLRIPIAAVTLAAALAAPASATIAERARYDDRAEWLGVERCGITVDIQAHTTGHYSLREGRGGAFYLTDQYQFTEIWTTEAGSVTVTANGLLKEIKATPVEGSPGVLVFLARDAGQYFAIYNSDGKLLTRSTGVVEDAFIFDTGGDAEPGGQLIDFIDHRETGNFTDICPAILAELT